MDQKQVKALVKEKYARIAASSDKDDRVSCCCNSDCDDKMDYTVFSEDYSDLKGYLPDADLSLGCGLPVEYAGINEGDSVLDLGSGAGNDCFVARTKTGRSGKVTGLDFTDEMIRKANTNLKKSGFRNIEFIRGDIENMPIPSESYDVVISNCVLNLVPGQISCFF